MTVFGSYSYKGSSGSSGTAGAAAASTAINIGRYTVISQGCVIKPPGRMSRGMMTYYPLRIGDNVFIGLCFVLFFSSLLCGLALI